MDISSGSLLTLFFFLVLSCQQRHALAIVDGLLPNGNFEDGPKPSEMNGTVVTGRFAIPYWEISGFVEYIESGHKQGDMLLVVPEGAYAVRLGNEAYVKQRVKGLVVGVYYSVTFSAARTCAQAEELNVSVALDSGVLPVQTIYSSDGWDSYSWAFQADFQQVDVLIHNPGVEEDPACGPLVDSIAIKTLYPPRPTNRVNWQSQSAFCLGYVMLLLYLTVCYALGVDKTILVLWVLVCLVFCARDRRYGLNSGRCPLLIRESCQFSFGAFLRCATLMVLGIIGLEIPETHYYTHLNKWQTKKTENLLKNGGFEEGPYVFPNTTWGVLVPPRIEDDHSPLPAWMVESLKAVRYIDSDHYSVPQGRRAVELVAGKESAIAQVVRTIPGRLYTLTFAVGDANNKCEGSMVVEAFAGRETVKVPYESRGTGGFKGAELRFAAISTRTRVVFFSTYYHTRSDAALCGPTIDDVKLLSVRTPPKH